MFTGNQSHCAGKKFTDMKTSDSKPVRAEIAPAQTQTLTVPSVAAPAHTDSLAVSATFVMQGRPSERSAYVEEDSTDIFTLERCSPLNDF